MTHSAMQITQKGNWTGVFICPSNGCSFKGDLSEAVIHAVSNQYEVDARVKPVTMDSSRLRNPVQSLAPVRNAVRHNRPVY